MLCPVCSHRDTKVIDSRLTLDRAGIRRRRQCLKCNFRFSTVEQIEILDLTVVKRDGTKQPYNRDKIIQGLRKALEKRSYTEESFINLVSRIERDIQKTKKNELTSNQIGEIVMRKLESFDQVGYIRYASVYRDFRDVGSFQREVKNIMSRRHKRRKKK
ncbi:MAG: transcriptional regulator NrdR [Candidatus Komeilibacteria bacterium RIFCSPLOWO2_01_FULL_52_15]|uniref:Transcriptional repressor NrdR n=2 Tax=Candidatus Komeiliibacteriota TaxID=1817908 RepID=A0A1G2BNG3_9BACT|nr:MAG: transcriptional regulator NrdR [Candidatus Komeilibacteria bacterium RIFCSPHIGHO2_01_FULL_52_14]OGY90638.1 MAG: transcriptional regulator NrdR [Candidatus Komeilibacteria bacterium RIFCSPLOWO2_01_FULL_52_15]